MTQAALDAVEKALDAKRRREIEKKPFITTTSGMSGFFAVHYWWNPEGFWEPYDTGFGRYAEEAQAIDEAKEWARIEELDYWPRN